MLSSLFRSLAKLSSQSDLNLNKVKNKILRFGVGWLV